MEDLLGVLIVVGLYVLLALLSWWGADAWDSWFMFAFGWLWWGMAFVTLLWFSFASSQKEDEDDSGPTG